MAIKFIQSLINIGLPFLDTGCNSPNASMTAVGELRLVGTKWSRGIIKGTFVFLSCTLSGH